jgi:hypothetical protein
VGGCGIGTLSSCAAIVAFNPNDLKRRGRCSNGRLQRLVKGWMRTTVSEPSSIFMYKSTSYRKTAVILFVLLYPHASASPTLICL